ncbi:MAG: DUF1461 domain-containing protein [Chloroflexi bacterium]|nr:DUF1461 domain-containing protein [Chloroflexota bacterium]
MASQAAPSSIPARLGSALVSAAAALVILGVSILPFFTPAWIHGEQDRAGSAAFAQAPADYVHWASDQIVGRLLLGGSFEIATPRLMLLLDPREQAHMQDVRAVFDALALVILAGAAVLAIATLRSRAAGAERRALWRAVGRGARWLAVLMAAVGVLSVVAFDAAFQVFHELLFPPGSFSFDPATEVLVQLYPDQFWSDTALGVGLVALALAIGVALIAGRRAHGAAADASPATNVEARSTLSPRSVP